MVWCGFLYRFPLTKQHDRRLRLACCCCFLYLLPCSCWVHRVDISFLLLLLLYYLLFLALTKSTMGVTSVGIYFLLFGMIALLRDIFLIQQFPIRLMRAIKRWTFHYIEGLFSKFHSSTVASKHCLTICVSLNNSNMRKINRN